MGKYNYMTFPFASWIKESPLYSEVPNFEKQYLGKILC